MRLEVPRLSRREFLNADLHQNSRLPIYRLWGGQLTLLTTYMEERMTYA